MPMKAMPMKALQMTNLHELGEEFGDEFEAASDEDVDMDELFGEDESDDLDDLTDLDDEEEEEDMDGFSDDFDLDLDNDPDLNEDGDFDDDEFDEDDFDFDDDDLIDGDEFEHTPFLFAELLEEAAGKYAEMSLDERMEESGETVMNITLDELSEFIKDLNKRKKGA